MKKIIEERKDIAFYLKLSPLRTASPAYEKSKAIVCEKSLALLEDAYEKKPLPKPACESKIVDETMQLAARLGISSVPSSILPDGRVVTGFKDAKTLLSLIGN